MEAGDILLKRGLVDQNQLQQSREADGVGGVQLLRKMVDFGHVREHEALKAIGEEVGLEFVDLANADIDLSQLAQFPQKLIYRQSLFPLWSQDGGLVVATSDPFDLYPLDEVSAATGKPVFPVLSERAEIDKLIKRHLGVGGETVEGLIEQRSDDGVEPVSYTHLTLPTIYSV